MRISPSTSSRYAYAIAVFAAAVLLLASFALRIYHLLSLPPFIDEMIYLGWARDVYAGHLLSGGRDGKLLSIWWLAVFDVRWASSLWLMRAASVLVTMLGAAAVYGVGRSLASKRAGLLALTLYLLAPFSVFYDRFVTLDSYVAAFGALSLYFCVRFARRGRSLDAILIGVCLAAGIGSKASGVMLVVFPALAFWLLWNRQSNRSRLRGLLLAYGALALVCVPIYLALLRRGWDYFGLATSAMGTSDIRGIPERVIANVGLVWDTNLIYLSGFILALAILSTLYLIMRHWRVGLFLTLATLLPVLALLAFATGMRGRYVLFHVPMLLVTLAVGLDRLLADLGDIRPPLLHVGSLVTGAAIVSWALLFALPFVANTWADPRLASLSPDDRSEYVTADSAGYALGDAARYLAAQSTAGERTAHVIGVIANCGALRWYLQEIDRVTVECPLITHTGSSQAGIAELIDARAQNTGYDLWIAAEGLEYADLDGVKASYRPIASFARPDNITRITLYRVN